MIRIQQLKLPIKYTNQELEKKVLKTLRIESKQLKSFSVFRRSLDARDKNDLKYVFIIDCVVQNESSLLKKNKKLLSVASYEYKYPVADTQEKPIIVGFGPAGIFAAYVLAKIGLKPVIVEQGEDVDARTKTVEKLWSEGILNEQSNVQFGEGGAGTFSDGKLTSRSKDPRSQMVFDVLVKHGAPEEILYSNKPHVGTDLLKEVVKSIRKEIISLGGEIHFNTKVIDILVENNQIKGVVTNQGNYYSSQVILAIGHSARETYELLYNRGVQIEQKPFAMGVRIEHLQETIDNNQYGNAKHKTLLGASDYKLTHKTSNGRSIYSFCVCPGGMVVASASEKNGLVVNGMSEHARDQKNINGALLVQVRTEDFDSEHPLAGVEFQRKYERLAFELGGSNYCAPSETVGSFLNKGRNHIESILPSYRPGIKMTSIKECLPDFIVESLIDGLENFGKKIDGFDSDDAILTAIESRSSAPVKFVREDMMSNIIGLYPVGEGAGYAGGIISSAIDGVKVAEVVAEGTKKY